MTIWLTKVLLSHLLADFLLQRKSWIDDRRLKKFKLEMEQLLVVMEYTGIYTYGLERYLHKERIAFVKRPALDIKRSLGMSW